MAVFRLRDKLFLREYLSKDNFFFFIFYAVSKKKPFLLVRLLKTDLYELHKLF